MQLSAISLALTRIYGGGAWSPSSLFANSEVGAWYDPSDLSTMFQDSEGMTPVTADGQPVGMILDKSKGLVLGPDIAPNTFNALNATITNGGTFPSTATATASTYGFVVSSITNVGKYYEYSMSWTGNINNRTINVGNGSFGPTSTLQSGTITGRVLTSGTQIYAFITGGVIGETFTVTDVTCKLVAGNHASQATAASRPLYKTDGTYHWLQFDGVDDSLSTAAIDFTGTNDVSAWMGVRPSASTGFIVSTGTNPDIYSGSLRYDLTTGSKFNYQLRGVSSRSVKSTADGFSFPSKNVNYGSLKFGTVSEIISRVNGSLRTLTNLETTNPVVGPFGNLAMYIGKRGDSAVIYAGNIYPLIIRGAPSTTQEITDTETWVNSKTGAY